ncbi:MAG TPA: chromosome condensation regulator RCC1, partial [Minicystis sp.]|nr:chromosome condensation regulator RCC1 [Minicystis sp.]
GDGTTTVHHTPELVPGLSGATDLALGNHLYACAVSSDGSVRCWGNNDRGQLGDGTFGIDRLTPTVVPSLTATTVAAGLWHTCAGLQDGTVRCWGDNEYGQLGDGTTQTSTQPGPVQF